MCVIYMSYLCIETQGGMATFFRWPLLTILFGQMTNLYHAQGLNSTTEILVVNQEKNVSRENATRAMTSKKLMFDVRFVENCKPMRNGIITKVFLNTFAGSLSQHLDVPKDRIEIKRLRSCFPLSFTFEIETRKVSREISAVLRDKQVNVSLNGVNITYKVNHVKLLTDGKGLSWALVNVIVCASCIVATAFNILICHLVTRRRHSIHAIIGYKPEVTYSMNEVMKKWEKREQSKKTETCALNKVEMQQLNSAHTAPTVDSQGATNVSNVQILKRQEGTINTSQTPEKQHININNATSLERPVKNVHSTRTPCTNIDTAQMQDVKTQTPQRLHLKSSYDTKMFEGYVNNPNAQALEMRNVQSDNLPDTNIIQPPPLIVPIRTSLY